MRGPHILISLAAVNLAFQILRFPHLILENGGGAFLILFILAIHFIGFPLLIAERVLDEKLKEVDLPGLVFIYKGHRPEWLSRILLFLWFSFRMVILVALLWFFLYLGGISFLYMLHFAGFSLGLTYHFADIPSFPTMEFSPGGALIWTAISFATFYFIRKFFFSLSTRLLLPFCFVALLLLCVKIILAVTDFEGLKILLYPDFSAMTKDALLRVIGHSLVCLFVGLGFFNVSMFKKLSKDPIEFFIKAVVQSLFVAVVVGLTALPMIQQISETPFGSNWVFEILPRWLSYGGFGYYYCFLFFVGISFVSFYMTVLIQYLLAVNVGLLAGSKDRPRARLICYSLFIFFNAAAVFFLQSRLPGWSGQSLLLWADFIIIDLMLPVLALLILWFVFKYTSRGERRAVFARQEVFFHSEYFYIIWEKYCLYVLPVIILSAWALKLI